MVRNMLIETDLATWRYVSFEYIPTSVVKKKPYGRPYETLRDISTNIMPHFDDLQGILKGRKKVTYMSTYMVTFYDL